MDQLRRRTVFIRRRRGFKNDLLHLRGAPTSVVDGKLYWGQDRLVLVERALAGWSPPG